MGREGSTMTKGTTSFGKLLTRATPSAGGAVAAPSTSRRRPVRPVGTLMPRHAYTTGHVRHSGVRLLAVADAATSRTCLVVLRTASVREPTQRRRSHPTRLEWVESLRCSE